MDRSSKVAKFQPALFIVMIAMIAHGLVLLNNGTYWDGWLLHGFQQSHNVHELHVWFYSSGVPITTYIQRFFWFFPGNVIYNLIGFFSVFAAGYFLYKILLAFEFPAKVAMIAGVFCIIYPGSHLTFFRILAPAYLEYGFFFIAAYLGLQSDLSDSVLKKLSLRVASLLLFFASFNFESLLPYFLMFIIMIYAKHCQKQQRSPWHIMTGLQFIKAKLDYIALPIVYWIMIKALFPVTGTYANYNHLLFTKHVLVLLVGGIIEATLRNLYIPFAIFLVCITAYALVKLFADKKFIKQLFKTTAPKYLHNIVQQQPYLYLLLLGALALILAILPYALIGKLVVGGLFKNFPTTRFSFLVPSAMGLILAALFRLFGMDEKLRFNVLGKVGVAILTIIFCLFWINTYTKLEGVSAIQHAVINNLKARPAYGNYSTYWIKYQFNTEFPQEFYSWGEMLNQAYGGHSRAGFPVIHRRSIQQQQLRYLGIRRVGVLHLKKYQHFDAANYNLYGPQAILQISPGQHGNNALKLGALYLYYRFIQPQQLSSYLSGLVNISLKPNPMHSQQASNHSQTN